MKTPRPYDEVCAARNAYERERRKRRRAENVGADHSARRASDRASAARRRAELPFIAIDSEGVSHGPLIEIDGAQCQKQRTVLWGAAGVDCGPNWLCPATAGRTDAPYCGSAEILDWLVSLPGFFGPSIFVWFGSSYDATQIFADLPYEKAWEIQHGKPFPKRDPETGEILSSSHHDARLGRYVFWGGFAISYLKQKFLTVGLLKNRDCPKNPVTGKLEFLAKITIYDVFGFFQTSFIEAAKSIPGAMDKTQTEIIEAGKKLRGDFTLYDLKMIKKYTKCELVVMAQMMTGLRETMLSLDLNLTRWQGAGSVASVLLKNKGAKQHFRELIALDRNMPIEQRWAHHAFFGGRIELLKQGATEKPLWNYDINSAYPHQMRLLPSMADGSFRQVENPSLESVKSASPLSMFKIRFNCFVELSDPTRLNKLHGAWDGPQFYPLPYRDARGVITYPPRAYGIYMQAEAAAALEWLKFFRAKYEGAKTNKCAFDCEFVIEEALFFEKAPGALIDPFSWLSEMYGERLTVKKRIKETGVYDLTEKVLKLGYNSCYGKTSQSVGTMGKAPATACPWIAAAITAGTRAQLLRAALTVSPEKIVAFMTDGIVTEKELTVEVGSELGQWDCGKIDGRKIFVQPGVYHYGGKSKHRGIKAQLLDAPINDFFETKCVAGWANSVVAFSYPYRAYISLGTAVASADRWRLAGYWADGSREMHLDNLGHKRLAPVRKKRERAKSLVPTLPLPAYFFDRSINVSSFVLPLSELYSPDWLDLEFGRATENARIDEEIAFTEGVANFRAETWGGDNGNFRHSG